MPTYGAMLQAYDGLRRYEKVIVVRDLPVEERTKGTLILVEDLTGDLHWVEEGHVRIDYEG